MFKYGGSKEGGGLEGRSLEGKGPTAVFVLLSCTVCMWTSVQKSVVVGRWAHDAVTSRLSTWSGDVNRAWCIGCGAAVVVACRPVWSSVCCWRWRCGCDVTTASLPTSENPRRRRLVTRHWSQAPGPSCLCIHLHPLPHGLSHCVFFAGLFCSCYSAVCLSLYVCVLSGCLSVWLPLISRTVENVQDMGLPAGQRVVK